MKKVLAVLLTLAMILSLGVTAFATEEPAEQESKQVITEGTEAGKVTPVDLVLVKEYEILGGNVTPGETISFDVEQISGVMDVDLEVSDATIVSKTVEEDADKKATFTLTFGEYTKVGRYEYKVTEIAPTPKTLGVDYDNGFLTVIVTIVNAAENTADGAATEDMLVAYVTVHKSEVNEDGEVVSEKKLDPNPDEPLDGDSAFNNTYNLGKLTVTKEVSGNLASNTKPFTIHVTFTDESGLTQGSKVSYTVAGAEKATEVTLGEEMTIDVELKNGDSAEFINIPAGIAYAVEEDDVHTTIEEGKTLETSEEGYTVEYDDNAEGEIESKSNITTVVTNTKETTPDTGIVLDSLPYVMIVAVAAAAVVTMIIRKRREVEG